jgi:hypothetical protein
MVTPMLSQLMEIWALPVSGCFAQTNLPLPS